VVAERDGAGSRIPVRGFEDTRSRGESRTTHTPIVVYRILADGVVLVHGLFMVFVVVGAVLVMWRPWTAWLHAPAVLWGVWIEFTGRICPLTPLENRYRGLAGGQPYDGGFIERYVTALIYPEGLARGAQVTLGVLVLVLNATVYVRIWRK